MLGAVASALSTANLYRSLFSRKARVRRAIERTPRMAVRDLDGGIARVSGRVAARGQPLHAPLSGRPCVAFELEIEGFDRDRRRRIFRQEAADFAVVDETGAVLVEPGEHFALALAEDDVGGQKWDDAQNERDCARVLRLLPATRLPRPRLNLTLAYHEDLLLEDDLVSVRGRVLRHLDPEGERGALRNPPARLSLVGDADEPLLITDLPAKLA